MRTIYVSRCADCLETRAFATKDERTVWSARHVLMDCVVQIDVMKRSIYEWEEQQA